MEALAAVSLAGNILQFIHSTRQLLSSSREIFDSGTRQEYVELETITRDLRERAERVTSLDLPKNASKDETDDSIQSLGNQCREIAHELLQTIQKLKSKEPNNKWESFHQALKTEWKAGEIEALYRRLDRVSHAINIRLLEYENRKLFSRLDALAEENRRLHVNRASEIMGLKENFERFFEEMRNKQGKELDEDLLSQRIRAATAEGLQYSTEQIVLEKLRFDRLEDRYSSISSAHRHTILNTALPSKVSVGSSILMPTNSRKRHQLTPYCMSCACSCML